MASKLQPAALVCLCLTFFFLRPSASSPLRKGQGIPRFPTFPASRLAQSRAANVKDQWEGLNGGYNWSVGYFTQTLDHFSFAPKSYQTFQQKFVLWDEAWAGAGAHGPIFVYCGNEGPVEWFANNAGFLREIAPEFGALVVAPEHRYYGVSMPFGSAEAAYQDAESRAYLTTEQAIADYALLLTDLKKNLSAEHSPIVLFGGSYGGMIAAWFRLKYPHIAIGAVASSAPILQFGDVVPPDTFYRIASEDFRRESESCFEAIRDSWAAISAAGSTTNGLRDLSAQFHMCRPLRASWELSDWLSSAYAYLAMVDYPLPADFLMPLPAYPVRELCKAVDGLPEGSSLLDRIFAGASVYYNYSGTEACFDPGADPHGMSGWDYQYCTEMVMPMASNASNSMFEPFSWDLRAVEDSCEEQFGVRPRPNWVLTQFGGKDIKSVLATFGSNMVFANGALDPWSGGSVTEDINPTVLASVIPDGAHHLDLRPATPYDPISLIRQREFEKEQIRRWLKEYYATRGLAGRTLGGPSEHMYAAVVVFMAVLSLLLVPSAVLVRRTRSRAPDRRSDGPGPSLRQSLIAAPILSPTIPVFQTAQSQNPGPNPNPNFAPPTTSNSPPLAPSSLSSTTPSLNPRVMQTSRQAQVRPEHRVQNVRVQSLLVMLLLPAVTALRPDPRSVQEGNPVSLPKDLVESDFNSTLAAAPTPWAMVEFFASWCPACQHFKPHYERVAGLFMGPTAAYPDTIFVARVDCAEQGALCQRFDIRRYPTMVFGKPAAIAQGSRKEEEFSPGVEHVEGGFAATSVLAWIAKRLDQKFTLDMEKPEEASKGEGTAKIRGAGTPALGQSRASLHDVEEATALSFRFIFSSVSLTPSARPALAQWVHLLAAHHPSPQCRKGSANLLATLDDLWPPGAAADSAAINSKALRSVQICGPGSPKGYWKECKGSKEGTRGYSCGLWLLFHSLFVRLDEAEGAVGMTAVRSFVDHFFGCGECRDHFVSMATRLEWERVKTRREAVLWLWRAHNQVNQRLAKEELESAGAKGDAEFPKQQWPPAELCPLCRPAGGDEWDEDQVFAFLVRHFESPVGEPGSTNEVQAGTGEGGGAGTRKVGPGEAVPDQEMGSAASAPLLVLVLFVGVPAGVWWWRQSHKRKKPAG